ncbi:MAG: efflux transporter outer membrane subunit [Akkermansiaceae bacterium]|nr:efflux transporter outer membrane subunit [Akkermansiaceae bacterium]
MKAFLLLLLTLASCTVGPDYEKYSDAVPIQYKAVGLTAPAPSGNWWSSFSDPKLSSLLKQVGEGNPQARAALARVDQGRAILGLRRSDLLPAVTGEALATRQQDSTRDIFFIPPDPYSRFRSVLNLSYEIDFWGRVRRSVTQQNSLMQAAAADYVTALLLAKAEVARDYLALRHLDDEIQLLSGTIALREENEKLVQARVNAGDTTAIDSSRARSQTETARAELHRLTHRRTELENAIAVLIGKNPSTFSLTTAAPPRTPTIPSGIPADLLRRRPDVAATERRLAASSEQIGINLANYYPRFSLTATGGYAALNTSDLFQRNSQLWNVSPNVVFPIATFGRKKRDRDQALASYREALENHRQSVLNAFRDVENALSGITNLDRALSAQRKSAEAAKEASRLVTLRYEAGLVSFFEVIDSQRQQLLEQRALSQTKAARHQATVQLIQALGGGWR